MPPPFAFLHQPPGKFRVLVSHAELFRRAQHGVHRLAGVEQHLRKVPRVVPPTVDDDALVAVHSLPVKGADPMHAGNLRPATLGIKKVNGLEDGWAPYVVADGKRRRLFVSCPKHIQSWGVDLGEVQYLEPAQVRLHVAYGFREYDFTRVLPHQAELARRQAARQRRFGAPVA